MKNVELILADAQVHAFTPDSYDLLTSRLGVMFFADPHAAFRNLIRALRPGGRLVMAVWATIDENPHWKIPFEIAVRHLGPPGPQPPHAPGGHALGERDYLRGILDGAGFGAIAIEARPFHVRVDYDSGSGRARDPIRVCCNGCSTKSRPTRRRERRSSATSWRRSIAL